MNYVLLVHVLETLSYLLHDRCRLFFWQLLFLLDVLKASIRKGLKDEVEILFVVEVPEERCEIFAVQVGLDLDLPQDVFLHFGCPDPLL